MIPIDRTLAAGKFVRDENLWKKRGMVGKCSGRLKRGILTYKARIAGQVTSISTPVSTISDILY